VLTIPQQKNWPVYKMDTYTPQSDGNIYNYVPHVFKHIYSISDTAIFLAKNAVVLRSEQYAQTHTSCDCKK